MWQVVFPLLAILLSDAVFAQSEPDGAFTTPPLAHSSSFFVPTYIPQSVNEASARAAPQPSPFFTHFTIESFGIGSSSVEPGYMFSSDYIATSYNFHGLECPLCIPGPRNLSRLTLPP